MFVYSVICNTEGERGEHSPTKAARRRTARVLSRVICNSGLTGGMAGRVERYSTRELIRSLWRFLTSYISHHPKKMSLTFMLEGNHFIHEHIREITRYVAHLWKGKLIFLPALNNWACFYAHLTFTVFFLIKITFSWPQPNPGNEYGWIAFEWRFNKFVIDSGLSQHSVYYHPIWLPILLPPTYQRMAFVKLLPLPRRRPVVDKSVITFWDIDLRSKTDKRVCPHKTCQELHCIAEHTKTSCINSRYQ